MRAIWSGAISFGLIYIPVKLYNATQSHAIDFDLLRKSDHCPIHYARVCRETNEEVPLKDIVKGYQFRKGEYIVLEDEDFRRANVKKSQTIEIAAFVNDSSIDTKYFEKPYYCEPVKEAKKAYALLREAMLKTKKVAVARFVMRTKEHLLIVKPESDCLVVEQLRFADEIRKANELDLPEKGSEHVPAKELDMAVKLVEQLSEDWKPENYKDTYYADLQKIIQQKIEGFVPEVEKVKIESTKVVDLFSKLKESIEMAKVRGKAA